MYAKTIELRSSTVHTTLRAGLDRTHHVYLKFIGYFSEVLQVNATVLDLGTFSIK